MLAASVQQQVIFNAQQAGISKSTKLVLQID